MPPYTPITFKPILKPRAWGGDTLRRFGKSIQAGTPTGESWELADLPDSIQDGRSRIEGGPSDGRTLRSLIEADPEGILGRAKPGPDGGFPLLVKLLDARDNLSVQLHPSADYAQRHPESFLKTEAWVILDADPGARIYAGIREDIDRTGFKNALDSGEVQDILVSEIVEPGDCVFLESGLCHALGAGILAAEIQTPSDTTFRVWDWNRNDPDRQLHIEQALECVRLGSSQRTDWPRLTRRSEARRIAHQGLEVVTLAQCDRFTIERYEPSPDGEGSISFDLPTNGMPHVLMAASGGARITAGDGSIELARGGTALIPAGSRQARIELQVRDNQRPALIHAVPPDPLLESLA
jgi:mannose-6-phosphate isomerase